MTSPAELLTNVTDQQLQDAQNHAARKAMHLSGVEYDGQTLDGQSDPPVNAAVRLAKLGRISQLGINKLLEAGIFID